LPPAAHCTSRSSLRHRATVDHPQLPQPAPTAEASYCEPGVDSVPVKVVTAVKVVPSMSAVSVPLPVAPLNRPVPAVTTQESAAVPIVRVPGCPAKQVCPVRASVIWSPLAPFLPPQHAPG